MLKTVFPENVSFSNRSFVYMQMQNQNLYKKSYTRKSPVLENELPNLYT